MNESFSKIWMYRLGFVAFSLLTVFMSLLPTQVNFDSWGTPDVIFALALAWIVRRPFYAPVVLVGLVIFFQDMMLQRPPGLYAALIMLAMIRLRKQAYAPSDMTFLEEWLNAALSIVAVAIALRVIMTVTFLDLPRFGTHFGSVAFTVAIYPLVALFSERVLRVTSLSLSEIEIARQEGRL